MDGNRHRGLVTGLSLSGLYIQTRASVEDGQVLRVVFPADADRPEIELKAVPVRRKRVPPPLAAAAPPGLGLEVTEAPDEYALLVLGEKFPMRFRIRIKEVGGSRSKLRTIYADDEGSAKVFVRDQFGDGWEIIEIEPID